MEQKEIMKNTLFNELQFYNIQYCYLCDLREIWHDIESFREITAKAKTFFSVSLCAIKDDYFLTLSRLYDKTNNANTKSIPNLIIKFQKNLHLFDNDPSINDMLNQFNQKINNDYIISIAIKGIRKKRDSILAHTDKEYFGNKIFERKIKVKLVKEPDNDYDKEAIRVELRGLGKVGYVANSPYTVLGESISAGRLYDLFGKEAEGRVLYVLDRGIVCELLVPKDWHDPRSFSFDKLKKLRRRDNGNQQQQN